MEKNTEFSINSPQLSIGVVPSSYRRNGEADFAGCITQVTIHSYEKSATEVAQQNPPAFWKTCRWQTARDQHLSDTQDLMGWTCADNEILTGLKSILTMKMMSRRYSAANSAVILLSFLIPAPLLKLVTQSFSLKVQLVMLMTTWFSVEHMMDAWRKVTITQKCL